MSHDKGVLGEASCANCASFRIMSARLLCTRDARAGGQAAIDGLDLQAGGDNSLGRTRALSAPTVRHAYDERLQADEAAEEEEDESSRKHNFYGT